MNTLVRWLTRSKADHSSAAQPDNRFRPAVERLDHRVVPSRSVSGFVYVDADDDGVFESGESPIPGVTVTLTGTDIYNAPVALTTTTNAAGQYLFDGLEAGVYTVAETQPAGYDDGQETQGTPPSGGVGPDRFTDLYFDAEGEVQYEGYNFGEKLRAAPSGVIGDRIWNDANGNGVQDGGEPGVAGVRVSLSGPGGPRTAVTDASGRYQFTGLAAGTYTVSFTTPAGYTLTDATVGTDRTIDSNFTAVTPRVTTTPTVRGVNSATVTLAAGATDQTIDGGLRLRTSAVGREDTPLRLSSAVFALNTISGATGVTITGLPAAGQLQHWAGSAWVAVTVGQTISKADVDAGRVRFVPGANESGERRYSDPGVGNMKNDYTRVRFSVVTAAAAQPGTLTIEVIPVVDLGSLDLSISRLGGHRYSVTGWYADGVWPTNFPAPLPGEYFLDRLHFALTGSSPDQDGSERTLIGLYNLVADGVKERIITSGGQEVKPDANGVVWIRPNTTYYITTPLCRVELDYRVVRQEVNAAGQVLDQASRVGHFGYVSPLVLDLDGNGVETISQDAGVQFDLDGDGVKESVGWVAPTDGLLALDLNGNGLIDNGAELFGNYTRLPNGMTARDGYEALAALDANGDGVVSAADPAFDRLRVWVDANSDGVSQPDELKTLKSLGIVSLSYTATGGVTRQNGNLLDRTASYTTADGRARAMVDVWFRSDVISTTPPGSSVDRPVAPAAESNRPSTPAERPRATALAVRRITSSLPVTESGSASGTPLAKVGGLGTPVGTEPAADALFEALKRARSVFVDCATR
jgi:hypothetical protein